MKNFLNAANFSAINFKNRFSKKIKMYKSFLNKLSDKYQMAQFGLQKLIIITFCLK